MPSTLADVSVVVLTRNSARTLARCLKSIVAERPGEIIAVDSKSTDATLLILRRYGVRVVADPSCSLGRARQAGVISASRKYLMFVDSDVELPRGCIKALLQELEENGWAAIHARLLSKDKNLTYWQNQGHWLNGPFEHSPAGPRDIIGTQSTLFRRDTLLRYPYDPQFVEASEDVDVDMRLVRDGHILGISARTFAYHAYRREFLAFFRQQMRYGRGIARLAHKYGSVRIILAHLHFVAVYLVNSLVRGRLNRIPYFASTIVGNLIGMATFRPMQTVDIQSGNSSNLSAADALSQTNSTQGSFVTI